MKKFLIAAVLLLLASVQATGQTVQQSGSVTAGHAVKWTTNGVISDAGTAANGGLTSLGVTASGPGICQNSGPITGAYNALCLNTTSTGASISLYNRNGATGGFTFNLNGTTQGFGVVTLPVTIGNLSCFANSSGGLNDCGSSPTSLTTFLAPYSGAVSRTNNSKMADIVSVFDFIPVSLQAAIKAGTSTTDVSSYLTAMQAAVPAGVQFFFPAGQYNIGAGATAMTGRTIDTTGVTFTGGGSITGAYIPITTGAPQALYSRFVDQSQNPILSPTGLDVLKAFGTPIFDADSGNYYYYYTYRTDGVHDAIGRAISTNGKTGWVEDVANNPVFVRASPDGKWDSTHVNVPNVWKEGATWYMLYAGYNGSVSRGGLATSTNGITWTRAAVNNCAGETGNGCVLDIGYVSGGTDNLEFTGIIKVGSTYYANIDNPAGLTRASGSATSTDLLTWTKNAANPLYTDGRYCADTVKIGDYYYQFVPAYVGGTTTTSVIELYRNSTPVFYPSTRTYLGWAIGPSATNGATDGTNWNAYGLDTPAILTDDITRSTFNASGGDLWMYYAGSPRTAHINFYTGIAIAGRLLAFNINDDGFALKGFTTPGPVTLGSTLNVFGNTTLQSGLTVGNGATIGGNFVVNGTVLNLGAFFDITGNATTISQGTFGLSGNISSNGQFSTAATTGMRYKNAPATYSDNTASGTIATVYTDLWGAATLNAALATSITNSYGAYFKAPVAGTNVTLTNNYALGADSANITTLTVGSCSGCAGSIIANSSTTSGFSANQYLYSDGTKVQAGSFGTGVQTALSTNVGAAGAPVLFNGALGTPSSGTLTSATGLPISTGLTGAGTGVLTALGINVGSAGAFVVNGGALGTPSSGTLTNATGLPISTGLTGAGTGVLTALGVNVGSAGAFVTFNGAGGTPSSLVGTNITGTAAGLTAGNVTTNANLTGPITSSGNATSVAAQTGTGSVFAMQAAPTFTGIVTTVQHAMSGNVSAPAWTTSGIRLYNVASTFTDTTSSGTVAAAYSDRLGGNTIAASSATTFTNYYTTFINEPTAGTNVTMTSKWALGADSVKITNSTAASSVATTGALNIAGGIYAGGQSYFASNIIGGGNAGQLDTLGAAVYSGGRYAFSSTGTAGGTADTILTRSAAATLRLGAAEAASPVNQTLIAQGSRVGTDTNVAGGNLTIKPGVGTGNATPSSLIFSSWIEAASGTGTQTAATALTIQRGQAITAGYTVATLPAGITGGRAHVTDQTAACPATGAALTGGGAVTCPVFYNGAAWVGG